MSAPGDLAGLHEGQGLKEFIHGAEAAREDAETPGVLDEHRLVHEEATDAPCPGRLVRSLAVRRDGHWWLTSGPGSVLVNDPALAGVLDGFVTAVAAADQAVADLRARQTTSAASEAGGRR